MPTIKYTYIQTYQSKGKTRNVFKKDKRRRIKKGEKVLVHKSYTDDEKLRMIIVKNQWTARLLANFVRK